MPNATHVSAQDHKKKPLSAALHKDVKIALRKKGKIYPEVSSHVKDALQEFTKEHKATKRKMTAAKRSKQASKRGESPQAQKGTKKTKNHSRHNGLGSNPASRRKVKKSPPKSKK